MRQLILLDTDTVVLRPIAELWRHFSHFGGAVLGVANEQTNMYQRASGWTEIGKKRRRAAAKLARDAHLYRVQQGVTANPLLVRVRVTPNQIMRTSTEYNRV